MRSDAYQYDNSDSKAEPLYTLGAKRTASTQEEVVWMDGVDGL